MERDLEEGKEINWEKTSRLRKPYLAALGGQWDVMKSFFEKNRAQLCSQMTVEEDTAFHIAAYSEEKELLQHLVNLLPATSSLFDALNKKNQHGNCGAQQFVDQAHLPLESPKAQSEESCGPSSTTQSTNPFFGRQPRTV